MDNENNVRNIVKEIIRELQNLSVKVNEQLILFYVRLLALNPNWSIGDENFTNRDKVYKLVMHVVGEFKHEYNANIICHRMQLYVLCSLEKLEESVKITRTNLQKRLTRMKKDIFNSFDIDIETIFKKMVYYITLSSGLGNPLMPKVLDEAMAALKSVLTPHELQEFTMMSVEGKDKEMKEIMRLVTGVRLYNVYTGKGGEGIENIPSILQNTYETIISEIDDGILFVMENVNLLTSALYEYYEMREEKLVEKVSGKGTSKHFEILKHLLIAYRQAEVFYRQLKDQFEKYKANSDTKVHKLMAIFKKLYNVCYMRIAIPAVTIFPLFHSLAEIWNELQNDILRFAKMNTIRENLKLFLDMLGNANAEIEFLVVDIKTMSDADRHAQVDSSAQIVYRNDKRISILNSKKIKTHCHFKFLGFDAWKLGHSEGGLFPGNPNLGIVKYEKNYFVFDSVKSGTLFCENPKDSLLRAYNAAREKLDLINLLGLFNDLQQYKDVLELVPKIKIQDISHDVAIQTELHPIESYHDEDYHWNVWQLKKNALVMADISKRKTVNVQSDKTFSGCPIHTQTMDLRDKTQQTNRDNYTNVPNPKTFIFGLRGRKDDRQFKIDLTPQVED